MARPLEVVAERSPSAPPPPPPHEHLAPKPTSPWFGVVLALAGVVLATGLFVPSLLGGDSSQDAVMAMRMHRENDWLHLIKNGADYLDKPHLLFWSAMIGYRLFGEHDWSYRLISVLVSVLGAWSTLRLGARLHGERTGRIAAVMFITAQTILLGNSDVRMDALLTGFSAFALWQLTAWVEGGRLAALLLGAAGLGLAFSAKGMIAVAVVGACVLFHIWARGAWRRLGTWHLAAGFVVFLLAIAPVLAAYYVQFDLHPEKVIRGRTSVSGVRFILLGQGFDRFSGRTGLASSNNPLFFFFNLLWAFFPWGLLLYAAWFHRVRELVRGGWAAFRSREQLTAPGALLLIALLSFSKYKRSQYLNIFMPMLAITTAAWLEERWRSGDERVSRRLRVIQDITVGGLLMALLVVNVWFFRPPAIVIAGAFAIALLFVASLRMTSGLERVWVPSAIAALLLNFTLNTSLFPQIARLEPGAEFAAKAKQLNLDWSRTFFVGGKVYQPFQFYLGHLIPLVELEHVEEVLRNGAPAFALVNEHLYQRVKSSGLRWRELLRSDDCPRSRLFAMLRPETRGSACPSAYLLELRLSLPGAASQSPSP
jgi:4-amino-4-deoxy-L-arabinose transferase-like glycosyltransferase